MGSAVNEEGVALTGKSLTEGKGSVNRFAVDAASACHSFWDGVGRETGTKGAWLLAGLAQHAGVAHFPCLPPQHLHTIGTGGAAVGAADMPCHDVMTPIRMASSIVKDWERRADIGFVKWLLAGSGIGLTQRRNP